MRSRTARLTVCLVAWIALAAGAWLAIRAERQVAARGASLQAFDLRAREASDGLSDLRAAEQAYVAVGQGAGFWAPKVAEALNAAAQTIAVLRQSAGSVGARSALDDAVATLAELVTIDKRARDFLASGQTFMASDVVFAEGQRLATTARQQVEAARAAEHRAFDAAYTGLRGQQAVALASGGIVATLVILLLGLTGARSRPAAQTALANSDAQDADATMQGTGPPVVRTEAPVLNAAARLCTDFGRVRDSRDLTPLLARAADLMDATGLVVWLGNAAGADLQPVLAHGYSPQALARMPPVARSSDNAAAAAYRTGELQIVPSRSGSPGAIVAPILSAEGCVGACSAEVQSGAEGSEAAQALASILAAQLASIIATTATETAVRDRTA